MYLVIVCYNCGQFLLAKTGQKTKRCPYCEARLALNKAKRVGSVRNARQALTLIQALKRNKAEAGPELEEVDVPAKKNVNK